MSSNSLSAVILAGGASSRIGFQKPFLVVNGRRLIDIILEELKKLFDEVLIVAGRKHLFEDRGYSVIEDIFKDCGPLGGIHAGLTQVKGDGALFVACDMPFLSGELISEIINLADLKNYDCIIPRHSKGIEPLHAVYSKKITPKVENCLLAGRFAVSELLSDCRCKYLDVDREHLDSFININTLEDLQNCRRLLSSL